MRVLFQLLRRSGALLPRTSIDGGAWTIVQLESHNGHLVLRSLNVPPDRHLHELYLPTVARVEELHLVLRGVEQVDGPEGVAGVVQEWRLKVPPELGGMGLASPAAQGINGWAPPRPA